MLIALCAEKGSPGVTTTAVVLASAWSKPAVIIEADSAGGDLGIRLRRGGAALPEAPTVLTVANAARSHRAEHLLSRHAHTLNPGVSVIPGPILGEQMSGVGDWEPLAEACARAEAPVFADLGHLHAGSRLRTFAAHADIVVVVGRSDATSVIRMRERLGHLATELGTLRGVPPRFFPLLVATDRHGPAHAADLLAILEQAPAKPFLAGSGYVALDPAAVRRVENGEDPSGRLARTALIRSARAIAATIEPSVRLSRSASDGTVTTGGRP